MKRFALLFSLISAMTSAETLKILNWSDYIDEEVVQKFSERYNVDIDYRTFEDVDDFDAQFILSEETFDVIFPPIDRLSVMVERNMVRPLDKAKLSNLKNVDPVRLLTLSAYDRDNTYALPYLWGTTGFGINVGKLRQHLGTDTIPASWDLLFDPEYAQKLSNCGISWLDSEIEMMPLSLNYQGLDSQSISREDFRKAEAHLSTVSGFVSQFNSEEYVEAFRDGELCISIGYSGDIYQAIWEAEELNNGQELRYVIPREGTFVWSDIVVIGSQANSDLAHRFVNELMAPETIAAITNYVWYANAVPSSLPLVDPEIANNNSIYPDAATNAKLFGYPIYTDSTLRTMKRRWIKVKCAAGQECLVPLDAIPTN